MGWGGGQQEKQQQQLWIKGACVSVFLGPASLSSNHKAQLSLVLAVGGASGTRAMKASGSSMKTTTGATCRG